MPHSCRRLGRRAITQSAGFIGVRWFQLWIASGLVLAIILLVSSISTYNVSRRLILDHLRGDLRSQAAMLEDQLQRAAVHSRDQLSEILQEAIEKSNGRVAWILVQNQAGDELAAVGSPAKPVFSTQEIRSHLKSRRPIFKTVGAPHGPLLVEVLPFVLPSGSLRPSVENSRSELGIPETTVEIAEYWAART